MRRGKNLLSFKRTDKYKKWDKRKEHLIFFSVEYIQKKIAHLERTEIRF